MSTPQNFADTLRDYATEHAKRENAALEEMCERMLVTPDLPGGIAVQRTWKRDGFTYSVETEYRFDTRVPPMTIGYLPDIYEPGF